MTYKHLLGVRLDKTSVKLFPNFTRHHLITHTYVIFCLKKLQSSVNCFEYVTTFASENRTLNALVLEFCNQPMPFYTAGTP